MAITSGHRAAGRTERRPGTGRHAGPVGERPHRSYLHEAVLYRGDPEFIARSVPFLRDGVALDQPGMVAVAEPRLSMVRDALGAETHGLHFVDMAELGSNPARIIPAWRRFVAEHGRPERPRRGLGEPLWPGRRPSEVVECQLHEALLNVAIDPDTPLWLRCPYDVDGLDPALVTAALDSHPAYVDTSGYRGSTTYGGAYHVEELFAADLPSPGSPSEHLAFVGDGLCAARQLVTRQAEDAGLTRDRVLDLTLAISEVVTNSLQHGGGRGSLRIWREADALICEIADSGHMDDPLVGRTMPTLTQERRRGLWLVNQLCDLVQVRSNPRGTMVRILSWLPTA